MLTACEKEPIEPYSPPEAINPTEINGTWDITKFYFLEENESISRYPTLVNYYYTFLEGNDIENKLGQPMVHLSFSPKFGVFDLMVMPYFRTLEFPGQNGRGRPPFQIADKSLYESKQKEYNPDLALRWSHSIKSFDFIDHLFFSNSTT